MLAFSQREGTAFRGHSIILCSSPHLKHQWRLNLVIFLDCQIAKLKTLPNSPAIQYINPPPCVGGVVVAMLSVCMSNPSTVYTTYSQILPTHREQGLVTTDFLVVLSQQY